MRPLIIDNRIKVEAEELKIFAEDNVFDTDRMLDVKNGHSKPAGDDPNYTMNIEMGYRIVYSVEQLGDRMFDHISISVDDKETMPNPHSVDSILDLFGFDSIKSGKNAITLENLPQGGKAVNVICKR